MFNYRTSDPAICQFYDVFPQEELQNGELSLKLPINRL